VVRFPDEMVEAPNKDPNAPLYGTKDLSILPKGITPDMVYAIIGTPRTKYGFLDAWLVRGTYSVEDGLLRDLTGTMVAGGNQHSRHWGESLTPEMARKIAEFVPGFPTKLAEFGGNGSSEWGRTSYGAMYRQNMLFQPASSYCEVCHSFKFDFKSQKELLAALGKPEELRKHTINKGITCEECHGAGAHLVGARGAGMPSNCERCHQRFQYNADEAKKDPKHPLSSYFKTACPPAAPKVPKRSTPNIMKRGCAAAPAMIPTRLPKMTGKTLSRSQASRNSARTATAPNSHFSRTTRPTAHTSAPAATCRS